MEAQKSRFTFTNNVDTELTAAKKDSKKRIRLERSASEESSRSSSAELKKKSKKSKNEKKSKKDKKDKKEKKSKKSKKRASSSESSSSSGSVESKDNLKRQKPERQVEWVPPQSNPWTGKPFSPKFFEILEKRKELPAWAARQQVLDLVSNYQVIIL